MGLIHLVPSKSARVIGFDRKDMLTIEVKAKNKVKSNVFMESDFKIVSTQDLFSDS
jgi:hypothetical protein